jgi:drug/metabolite transporter (DMT)-like permease
MVVTRLGELFALATAGCWVVTAMSFEAAGKRVGSLAVNLIRLYIGFACLVAFCGITRGLPLPLDAPPHQWFWLSLSGIVGLALGDLFLFRALVILGARISMLIMALVPLLTTLLGWLVLKETMTAMSLLGMALTVTGIALVILQRNPGEMTFKTSQPIAGLLFALGGALGQAGGLILSKYGMGSYNAFASTQIRQIAGLVTLSALYLFLKAWPRIWPALKNGRAMATLSLGSFFGPFLGVSFSLLALQNTNAGVASTIMAIGPVLIIPPAIILFKEKITAKEVLGAVLAVAGVAILFLRG